jgi:predicted nucleic-acid-binding Zn-ribbon protein
MDYQLPQEAQTAGRLPTCPLCGGQQFQQEEGWLDSRWGFTTHRITLLICQRCQYILQFYDKHSIWDFD